MSVRTSSTMIMTALAGKEETLGYHSSDGWSFVRETHRSKWTLRNGRGDYVDSDQYRHDLAERHNIQLIESRK